jgi:two-component system chemotaxis sensor kinase CheA
MLDQEVLSDFIAEAREHLETIEPSLLELEKNPEQLEILNDIFRPMHSLKGASGFLNLNGINQLAHRAENILDALRKGSLANDADIMDLILAATDALRQMLDNLENQGDEGEVQTEHLIRQLDDFMAQGGSAGRAAPDADQGDAPPASPDEDAAGPEAEDSYALSVNAPDHLSDFLEEAREMVSNLNACLVELERGGQNTDSLVQDAFRYFHNLKGNSGLIGHHELNAVTHEAESLLNGFRSLSSTPNAHTIDALLRVLDLLERLIGAVDQENGLVKRLDVAQTIQELQAIGQSAESGLDGQNEATDSYEAASSGEPVHDDGAAGQGFDPEDVQVFSQTVAQQLSTMDAAMTGLQADDSQTELVDALYRSLVSLQNASGYMGFEDVKLHAERTAHLVDQGRQTGQGFEMLLPILEQETDILKDMLDRLKGDMGIQDWPSLSPGSDQADAGGSEAEARPDPEAPDGLDAVAAAGDNARPDPQAGAELPVESEPAAAADDPQEDQDRKQPASAAGQSKAKAASTIRVDHEKLDHLMNLIGELIINRNRFALISKELEEGKDATQVVQHLTESTDAMARISNDLQDTIMQVRMVPVRTVFSRFPRLVRDLSRKSGKEIELITEGEETELDKSVVESIGDPLVHLIRNAVDHGLESPEQRHTAGKDSVGRIWLRASHEGNAVVIKVEDDGKGIDPERIRDKAVEKGVIGREEADKLEDREAVELIFAPGFSTAQDITDVSGRGVGMDVVKNNIKSLNGNVTVQSEKGRGSTFILSLPLTLAIIEALLVTIGESTFAIPLDAVSEVTKISASQISEVNKRKAITLRGQVLGIVELAEVLGLSNGASDREVLPLVIITVNEKRLGLVVDALLHRQEIVIKSLGEFLGELRGLSGATIMGDGSVITILDPNEIFSMTTIRS